MPKQYLDFGFLPDFTRAPTRGMIDEKSGAALSSAPDFIEWPWPTPQRTFRFEFAFSSAAQIRAVRLRNQRIGGRHATINLPTWERDFQLAESITSGDREIEIVETTAGYVADFLPDDREDTPGRIVYFWTPGQTEAHISRIVRIKASATGGQEIMELESPVPFAVDKDLDWFGWALVARMGADEISWNFSDETHARFQMEFRQLRTHVLQEQSTTLDEVAAPTATAEAFETIVLTDADAPGDYGRTHTGSSEVEGPATRATVAHPYRTDWTAWFATGGIRFEQTSSIRWPGDDTNGSLSTLANSGAVESDHLSLCFDGAAVEVLAWEVTPQGIGETFQIRHFDGGAQTRGPFVGFSPILVFNGVVVVPPTSYAVDADVVVIYLKTESNSLFARIDRDDFATETEICQLPFKLRRLVSISRSTDRLVIVGIDDGQRKVEITSAVYA